MLMTEYETTMVMRPDLSGEAIESTIDRVREVVKSQGGKLIAINHWGKKKLAYEIKKQVRGIFIHTQYLGQKGLVAELERNLRISDSILRYETIRTAIEIDATTRDEKTYVKPKYESDDIAEREEKLEAVEEINSSEEYEEDLDDENEIDDEDDLTSD
ncbi:MAG: 30S ribosomal protein S6 [Deltaproteobacteria bacterium]|nr:30S ribosomal protein S6 [Deltaproteobacteria bacterium]